MEGMGIGTGKVAAYNNEIEYKFDAYFTWGWSEIEDFKNNFIALPSPMLSKTMNKHNQRNNKIIFIGAFIGTLYWTVNFFASS